MQFIGKIVGFILGYKFLGGLWGGILGAFVGHLGDKKLYELGSVSSSFFAKPLSRQSLFMQTTFAVLGHISKAKGRVTEDDIQLARRLMSQLKLDNVGQQQAQEAFIRGKEPDFPLRRVMQEFSVACAQRSDLLRFFVEVQMQAALHDGQLDPNEQRILLTIAETIGISKVQFEQMMTMVAAAQYFRSGYAHSYQYQSQSGSQYQKYHHSNDSFSQSQVALDQAYALLGVKESDDQNTVKRIYRRLMNEHHPDKLVAKGLPPEMMNVAKEKAQQIQAAYDLICKSKGWK